MLKHNYDLRWKEANFIDFDSTICTSKYLMASEILFH